MLGPASVPCARVQLLRDPRHAEGTNVEILLFVVEANGGSFFGLAGRAEAGHGRGQGRVLDAWSVERGAWSEPQPAWNERAAAERGRVDALGVTTATDEPRRLLDSDVQPTVSMPPWCAALFTLAPSP